MQWYPPVSRDRPGLIRRRRDRDRHPDRPGAAAAPESAGGWQEKPGAGPGLVVGAVFGAVVPTRASFRPARLRSAVESKGHGRPVSTLSRPAPSAYEGVAGFFTPTRGAIVRRRHVMTQSRHDVVQSTRFGASPARLEVWTHTAGETDSTPADDAAAEP